MSCSVVVGYQHPTGTGIKASGAWIWPLTAT